MTLHQFFTELLLWIHTETDLVKERLKSISLEEFLVIRRIIIHSIQRRLETLHHKSPPAVALTKIDRSVHALHALGLKPLFCFVEQGIRCIPVVDAVKKANAANGHFISFILIFLI